jgi:hypothetical protein
MATLSPGQIASVLKQAGWPAQELPLAVAIVLGESGGRTDARGDESLMTATWGPSIGLFQIRSVKAERGKGTTRDELANLDPLTNARHALTIRKSQGFAAWTVFNTKAYAQFMGKALLGVANPSNILPDLPNPVGDTIDGLNSIKDTVAFIVDPKNWVRVGMFFLGTILMWMGIAVAFFGSSAGDTTIQVTKSAAKLIVAKKAKL